MLKFQQEPFIQEIKEEIVLRRGLRLFIKREDLIHPIVSGNKWRKLKYNLLKAREDGYDTLLTFGGAYSNHIFATAAAAREAGFQSTGIVRGEELALKPLNNTLSFAKKMGMDLHFVDRETYREKSDEAFINKLREKFGNFYLLPEGGTNNLAIRGCEEIVTEEVKGFDYLCTSVGTGGTISGVIAASSPDQEIIGFSALKGDFLIEEVRKLLTNYSGEIFTNWHLEASYHFGGYARSTSSLLSFIKEFENKFNVPLDPIYTGKMMYGIFDKIGRGHFEAGTKILAIHTGGLQDKLLPFH